MQAKNRGYHFTESKIKLGLSPLQINVTSGQIEYEFTHLRHKIDARSPERLPLVDAIRQPQAHPLFKIVRGEIEPWEKVLENQPKTTQRIESEPR